MMIIQKWTPLNNILQNTGLHKEEYSLFFHIIFEY